MKKFDLYQKLWEQNTNTHQCRPCFRRFNMRKQQRRLLAVSFLFVGAYMFLQDRQRLNDLVDHHRVTMVPKKPKKNLLLTAYVLGSPTARCQAVCQATRNALKAGTECAARTMGSEWEAMVVTDLDELEAKILPRVGKQQQQTSTITPPVLHGRQRKLGEWQGPGPFPHYAKIHILERLMFSDSVDYPIQNTITTASNSATNYYSSRKSEKEEDNVEDDYELDWLIWVDADVRIVNASYPVSRLLDEHISYERAPYYGNKVEDKGHNERSSPNDYDSSNNDVSIVVMSQYANNIINDLFFLKKSPWGKRFLQAWKHFTLNAENNDDEKWRTCGYYDQCPFGVAMLQVAQDYQHCLQQQKCNSLFKEEEKLNWLQSRPYNTTLEELAFRSGANIQNTLFSDELIHLMSSQSNNWKDTNVPLQIGPILLVPTWEGGLRLPSTSSSSVSDQHQWNESSMEEDSKNNDKKYDLIPSSLTVEPTGNFEKTHAQSPWPFAVHAKYSKLFCHRYAKYFFDFELKYKAIHQEQCTSSELSSMRNDKASCWAKWQKSVRTTD